MVPLVLFCAVDVLRMAFAGDPMAQVAEHANRFAQRAPSAISRETLIQHSYQLPHVGHFAIGRAAEAKAARFVIYEVISDYAIGSVKGDRSGKLFEFREIVSVNGTPLPAAKIPRKQLVVDGKTGEDQVRKAMLAQLTRLGLVDVATNYALLLLAFTTEGQKNMAIQETGASLVGVDEAAVFQWRQLSGGAREFGGRNTAERALNGSIWVRKSDGAPLRISAVLEHREPKYTIRDEASIEYVYSPAVAAVTPASVAYRHMIDGFVLTENIHTYARFRLFTSDSQIRFAQPAETEK